MDLVYIVKESDKNEDLRYSLRSVAKFLPNNKVWIVGYKPSWVRNVEYLPVKQNNGSKWKNSIKNIEAACKCKEISEEFVLMNDDFFAIKPIKDLKKSIDLSVGTLDVSIKKYSHMPKSNWNSAFQYVYDLLKDLNIEEPYYDYEVHAPLRINKEKYLEVMNLPKVQEFMKTSKVLHKRTLYRNIDKINPTIISSDVKLKPEKDDTKIKYKVCDWLSVYDEQVGNGYFKDLNYLLSYLFSNPCKYEDLKSAKKQIITFNRSLIPVKKSHDFIHY